VISWVWLGVAIVAEVVATSALKTAEGFTRPLPSVLVIAGWGIALYCLSLALRTIPVGVAYAIWSGLGTALVVLIAWLVFSQRLDLPALVGIGLIVAGVIVITLGSQVGVE